MKYNLVIERCILNNVGGLGVIVRGAVLLATTASDDASGLAVEEV